MPISGVCLALCFVRRSVKPKALSLIRSSEPLCFRASVCLPLFLWFSLCLSLSLSVSLCIFCSELGFPPQLVSKLPLPTQNKFDLFVSNPPLLHIDFCIPMLSFFFFEMLGQRYSYAQRSAKSFLVFCYIFYISICVIFGILTSLIFRISVKIILSDCFSSSSGRLIDYIQPDSAASSPLFVFFKKIKLGVF